VVNTDEDHVCISNWTILNIVNAFLWTEGELTDYSIIAEAYEKIEAESKRLGMTGLLVKLFKTTDPQLMDKVVYLTAGRLYPQFVGIELGLAEKLVIKALAFVTGLSEKNIEKMSMKEGDLGKVAELTIGTKRQSTLFSTDLTLERVYKNLETIAKSTGSGAQNMKIKLLGELLHDSGPLDAKYITRTVVGKLRLGIADMTIIDALARAFCGIPGAEDQTEDDESKEKLKAFRSAVEYRYNISSDLGAIAKALATKGPKGLDDFHLSVGNPVRPMLAERLPSVAEIVEKMDGKVALEYKYDGLRTQCHIGPKGITLYSRQLENVTDQFPDVIENLQKSIKAKEVICEGECVPINIETGEMRPFQEVSHRRGRKYDLEDAIDEFPVALFLFDCLYVDGEDLMGVDYLTRRERMKKAFKETDRVIISESVVTSDVTEAEAFFNKSIETGCEGVMAKRPDSAYEAGGRGWNWIKYKRDYKAEMADSADLVVVGAFAGHGKRQGVYGALLMACYNPDDDQFETVCKLGTGFSDEFLIELKEKLTDCLIKQRHPRVVSSMKVDYHFRPEKVMEVAGAEVTLSPIHTCAKGLLKEGAGLAIRFPRYTGKWRDDKGPENATTTSEMISFYKMQIKKS
jgi:DNA ligase-1